MLPVAVLVLQVVAEVQDLQSLDWKHSFPTQFDLGQFDLLSDLYYKTSVYPFQFSQQTLQWNGHTIHHVHRLEDLDVLPVVQQIHLKTLKRIFIICFCVTLK